MIVHPFSPRMTDRTETEKNTLTTHKHDEGCDESVDLT